MNKTNRINQVLQYFAPLFRCALYVTSEDAYYLLNYALCKNDQCLFKLFARMNIYVDREMFREVNHNF